MRPSLVSSSGHRPEHPGSPRGARCYEDCHGGPGGNQGADGGVLEEHAPRRLRALPPDNPNREAVPDEQLPRGSGRQAHHVWYRREGAWAVESKLEQVVIVRLDPEGLADGRDVVDRAKPLDALGAQRRLVNAVQPWSAGPDRPAWPGPDRLRAEVQLRDDVCRVEFRAARDGRPWRIDPEEGAVDQDPRPAATGGEGSGVLPGTGASVADQSQAHWAGGQHAGATVAKKPDRRPACGDRHAARPAVSRQAPDGH